MYAAPANSPLCFTITSFEQYQSQQLLRRRNIALLGLYVFCSMFFLLSFLIAVSVSLLSVYCCLLALSDTT
jgi:hypothetical protein